MGVPPFLVASTINIAMGQRLVRKLCDKCKVERVLTAEELQSLGEIIPDAVNQKPVFFMAGKCDACGGKGYSGRVGVREVLEVNAEIRHLIMNHATAQDIKDAAVRNGMTTMLKDGFLKALRGLTSIEEVLRIIHD
jgi:type II secretory ATPase GspE/PulE/Tfp pilus assembly ATPase PilB-like protein